MIKLFPLPLCRTRINKICKNIKWKGEKNNDFNGVKNVLRKITNERQKMRLNMGQKILGVKIEIVI